MTGVMIFAFLTSVTSSIIFAIYNQLTGLVPASQSLQYVLHFAIGDTIGTAAVVIVFHRFMMWAITKSQPE